MLSGPFDEVLGITFSAVTDTAELIKDSFHSHLGLIVIEIHLK
jgi:hypothetical protein